MREAGEIARALRWAAADITLGGRYWVFTYVAVILQLGLAEGVV